MAGHPPLDDLARFWEGTLDDAALGRIEGHLGHCPPCRDRLKSFPPDRLSLLLRDSRPARGPSASGDAGDGELPAGLGRHPRYRVVGKLGAGGMGIVFLAEHDLMKRTVALKVIHPRLTANPVAAARFRREMEAVARLSHPHIAVAHDADEIDGQLVLVEEYVAGKDLARVVRERGPLAVATACDYIRQAALALGHAHERGILHRDIKPHNLIVTPDGCVKVLDFGLASLDEGKDADQSGADGDTPPPLDRTLTGLGQGMGTAAFAAPEQVRDAHAADARADVYSLGVTLVFLLTGETNGNVPASRPNVPRALIADLKRMTAANPAQRFQTMTEVAKALAPFTGDFRQKRSRRRITLGLLGAASSLAAWFLIGGPAEDQGSQPKEGPVAHYRFEEGSGGMIVNAATEAEEGFHDARYAEDTPPGAGANNRWSLAFDRPGEVARFPGPFLFHRGQGDGTLEFWVKPRGLQNGGVLFWTTPGRNDTNRFNIYIGDTFLGCDYVDPNGSQHELLRGDGPFQLDLDAWNHVAITRRGNVYQFFKNGELIATATDQAPDLPTATGWSINGRSHDQWQFVGCIDEIRCTRGPLEPSSFLNAVPR